MVLLSCSGTGGAYATLANGMPRYNCAGASPTAIHRHCDLLRVVHKGYGESMHVPQDHEEGDPPPDASGSKARQWCRAVLALALLFASLPLAGKLFLGSWRFDGALDLAFLCTLAGAYLYFVGRDRRPQIPDSAAILDKALQLAGRGATRRGLALLD